MRGNAHRLLLITTGGTIAGHVAYDRQATVLVRKSKALAALLTPIVGNLNRALDLDIQLDTYAISDIDSSDIVPLHWVNIAALIQERYDDYDSFVVTHGTNTLGYTASALSFALVNLWKPVILTGSQVAAGLPGSDALTNLENAIRVAVSQRQARDGPLMRGVVAVFGSHIIAGTRVKKDTEFDYDGFKSFSTASIGRIGRIINIDEASLQKLAGYHVTSRHAPAATARQLICKNEFDMRIASLTEFPGMSPGIIFALVREHDTRGFILRSFGAGDPSERHLDVFRFLKEAGIPVVVTTQAPNGISNSKVNDSGTRLRDETLAIPAHDMSIEAMTTKLG